jgi:hypothetical protein
LPRPLDLRYPTSREKPARCGALVAGKDFQELLQVK